VLLKFYFPSLCNHFLTEIEAGEVYYSDLKCKGVGMKPIMEESSYYISTVIAGPSIPVTNNLPLNQIELF